MRRLRAGFWRLGSLFHKRRDEQELAEELETHLQMHIEDNLRAGMTPQEARRRALIKLGGLEQTKEICRDRRGLPFLETFLQDLRYGARMLARHPGFTATAVLTLGLGIGVNTAMFSIVNLLLLRPLPIEAPDQITFLTSQQRSGTTSRHFSYLDLQDIRQQASSAFSDVAGVQPFAMEGLGFNGKSEPMWTSYVSGNFFEMMGVRPALGRLMLPAEGQVAGADPILVLGYAFWKSRFGGDPGIVGKTVEVNGHPVTVIGVAPEGFRGISEILDTQGYLPVGMQVLDNRTQSDFLSRREAKNLFLIARLRAGVGIESAQSTLRVVGERLAREYPKENQWTTLQASHLGPLGPFIDTTDPMPMVAAIFLTLAALVLLLAGVNVANTLLVRATVRQREMAIRAALGAARARLVRQLLTESLVLGLLGCAGGIFLGVGTIQALSAIPVQTALPIVFDFRFDWRVFTYAFAAGLLVALLVGTFPALMASRSRLSEVLHEGGRSVAGGGQRLRKSLVVLQVAGSLVLLIIAGLFARSLRKVQHSDLGFDPSHVFNLSMDTHEAGYNEKRARAFQQELLERVRALPEVQSASLAATVPMGYYSEGSSLQVEGYEPRPGHEDLYAGYNVVSSEYFTTMRIPLVQGRDIRNTDGPDAPRVAIINQAMAERFWPQQNPLGRHFAMSGDPEHPLEVIGVVKNSRTGGMYGPFEPHFYLAFAQKYALPVTLQVRTAGSPEALAPQVLGIVRTLEPAMPVFDVMSMTKALDTLNGLMQFRLASGLAACFGMLGLILALVGVYGVVSYSAVQRTHEIGIRMALGAERQDVLRLVIGQGFRLTFLGVAIGVACALALAQLLASLLYEVEPTDPVTFITISLFLTAVALLASYIPARRATKADPMVALRYE